MLSIGSLQIVLIKDLPSHYKLFKQIEKSAKVRSIKRPFWLQAINSTYK